MSEASPTGIFLLFFFFFAFNPRRNAAVCNCRPPLNKAIHLVNKLPHIDGVWCNLWKNAINVALLKKKPAPIES